MPAESRLGRPDFQATAQTVSWVVANAGQDTIDPYIHPEEFQALQERKAQAVTTFGQFCLDAIALPEVTSLIIQRRYTETLKNEIPIANTDIKEPSRLLRPDLDSRSDEAGVLLFVTDDQELIPMLRVTAKYKSWGDYTGKDREEHQKQIQQKYRGEGEWEFTESTPNVNLGNNKVLVGRKRFDPLDLVDDELFLYAFANGIHTEFKKIKETIITKVQSETITQEEAGRVMGIVEMVEAANAIFEEGFQKLQVKQQPSEDPQV